MFLTALIFGILAGSLALIAEIVFLDVSSLTLIPVLGLADIGILFGAVLIEEATRLLFLYQFFKRFFSKKDPSWVVLCLLGLFYGLGYATLELGFIIHQGGDLFGFLGIALIHTALSILFALVLSRILPFSLPFVFILAVLLHLVYNFSLILSGN